MVEKSYGHFYAFFFFCVDVIAWNIYVVLLGDWQRERKEFLSPLRTFH